MQGERDKNTCKTIWLEAEYLEVVIKESWSLQTGARDAVANLAKKLTRLRMTIRKWERRNFGMINGQKKSYVEEVSRLERLEER